MKTFSYRLHKLGTPKMLRTEGQCGPISRPAFAKVTQVKNVNEMGNFPTQSTK